MSISICIPTYKRRDHLALLLSSLELQQLAPERQTVWEVVVIDNDPEGTAASIYKTYLARGKLALRYLHEPRNGLSYVRNAAIDAVIDHADFIGFIDDDQTVNEIWLDEMLRMQRESGAECITGRVISVLPPNAPDWVKKGGFFDNFVFNDGQLFSLTSTANLMMATAFLKRSGLRFDNRFRHTGGEDTFFFTHAVEKHELKIVGAAEAIAYETVFPSRIKLPWILKRAFRAGGTLTQCERLYKPSLRQYLLRAGKAFAAIMRGVFMLLSALLKGRYMAAKGMSSICLGFGEALALLGYVYKEYGTQAHKKGRE